MFQRKQAYASYRPRAYPKRRWQSQVRNAPSVTSGTTSTKLSASRIGELESRLNTLALSVLSQRLSTLKRNSMTPPNTDPPSPPDNTPTGLLQSYLKATVNPNVSAIQSSSSQSISSTALPIMTQRTVPSQSELSSLPTETLQALLQQLQMSSKQA